MFSVLPATINGWVEDDRGQTRGWIRPSNSNPGDRGLRFRPRCNQDYYLVLRTEAGFSGEEDFTVITEAFDPNGFENPWTSTDSLGEDRPPLPPDQDADGLIDMVDTCPATYDPYDRDDDGDLIGNVCDVCPTVANPDQMPVEFEMVLADGADTLSWPTVETFNYVRGSLNRVGAYVVEASGFGLVGDQMNIASDPADSYYLFKRRVCGTWGHAGRDGTLP